MNRWIRIKNYSIDEDKKELFALQGIIARYLEPHEYRFTVTGVNISVGESDKIVDTILEECKSCKLSIVHN